MVMSKFSKIAIVMLSVLGVLSFSGPWDNSLVIGPTMPVYAAPPVPGPQPVTVTNTPLPVAPQGTQNVSVTNTTLPVSVMNTPLPVSVTNTTPGPVREAIGLVLTGTPPITGLLTFPSPAVIESALMRCDIPNRRIELDAYSSTSATLQVTSGTVLLVPGQAVSIQAPVGYNHSFTHIDIPTGINLMVGVYGGPEATTCDVTLIIRYSP